MYSDPGIQGVLRTRILALFHRRIEVTRNLVPYVAQASVGKQNENLTEVNIWPPCMHIMFGKVFYYYGCYNLYISVLEETAWPQW